MSETSDGQGGSTCTMGDKQCYDDLFSEEKGAPGDMFASIVQGVENIIQGDSPTAPSTPNEQNISQDRGIA